MGTRHLRARVPGGRGAQRGKFGSAPKAKGPATLPRADRKSLLLGTALASTLIVGVMVAPTPAPAVQTCFFDILPFINHTASTIRSTV